MIVILNGPSSSGKTTLSRALQRIWPKPLYYFSYDSVDWHIAPFSRLDPGQEEKFADPEDPEKPLDPVRDFLTVMYLCAAAVSRSGRDAVIDNCLFDTEDIYPLSLRLTEGCGAFFVRLDVSPGVLAARETARGDRTPGKALWQLAHRTPKEDEAYDLILDGERPPEENARLVLAAVREAEG